jgi:hypothetical protein
MSPFAQSGGVVATAGEEISANTVLWRKRHKPNAGSPPTYHTTMRIDGAMCGALVLCLSLDGACTNWAEEFFSRMRRAEIGHHHHVAGPYLLRFAQEASWREDNRRLSNGEQVNRIAGLAMASKQSVDFTGYWQRHI